VIGPDGESHPATLLCNTGATAQFGCEESMNAKSSGLSKMSHLRSFLKMAAADAPPKTASRALSPALVSDPPAAVQSKKILIVDDDLVILKTTSMKLRSQGYAVVTATDGATAIQAVRQEKPDLILLDLNFPPDVAHGGTVGWDGLGIISWLRRLEEAKNIPVVIITSSDPAKIKQPLMAAGALAFVRKPIEHEGLLSTIKQALDQKVEKQEPNFGADFDICL
jgi:CheY-like chemotaxis protein